MRGNRRDLPDADPAAAALGAEPVLVHGPRRGAGPVEEEEEEEEEAAE